MKANKGVSLLEVLVATTVLTMILLAAGAFFLSSLNICADTQDYSTVQRNAQIIVMHMEKYISQSVTDFAENESSTIKTLEFKIYNTTASGFLDNAPSYKCIYLYDIDEEILVFNVADENNGNAPVGDMHYEFTGKIKEVDYSWALNDGVLVNIEITAAGNNGDDEIICKVTTAIEARLASSPAFYRI